jgi:hypothetical protein
MEQINLSNSEIIEDDAFNGCGRPGCKFDVRGAKTVGQLAFWQTGAERLDLPNIEKIPQNAIEENDHLTYLNLGAARLDYLAVCSNPNLACIAISSMATRNAAAIFDCPNAKIQDMNYMTMAAGNNKKKLR